jgi:hypothetical protein
MLMNLATWPLPFKPKLLREEGKSYTGARIRMQKTDLETKGYRLSKFRSLLHKTVKFFYN